MRVLVTGSHGYIGSILAPFLAGSGHEVVGLDTRFYRGCDFGADEAPVPTLVRDVRDVVAADLEGFDAIVHLAALSNDPIGDLDPALTMEINGEATIGLACAARDAGAGRFVFSSSCSMYGAGGGGDTMGEDAPLRPLTPYAASKVTAEQGLFALEEAGFAPVSMRNATVFGVSPRLRLDVVLNNLAAWVHTTGRIRLLSDGSAWRPLVHVRDVAKATLAILEAPVERVSGEAFNVGSDNQNYVIRELAEILSETTGCVVETAEGSSADQRSYRVDFGRLASSFPDLKLDWDAERGAHELVDAYATAGLTTEEFEGDRYVRLRRLGRLLNDGALDARLRWRASAGAL